MWPRRVKATEPAEVALPGSKAEKPEQAVSKSSTGLGPAYAAPKRRRIGDDLLLGLFGVALGLGCALFPWYVFFNQEKFGIRAVKFDSTSPSSGGATSSTPQIARTADPAETTNLPTGGLDQLATGTTPRAAETKGEAPSLLKQPFPTQDVPFRLVHIANGRAMIEDASGLWIVQRGSVLPDMSRVTAIEQRDGQWVLVTNSDRVIGLTR